MKQIKCIFIILATLLLFANCQKHGLRSAVEDEINPYSTVRSYKEAKEIAEFSLSLIENVATKSGDTRRLEPAQCFVKRSAKTKTGGGKDTLLYVFNFANDEGFSIIAANKNTSPLIAVVESGHYEPGKDTGVEPFDLMMRGFLDSLDETLPDQEMPHHYYEYYSFIDSCDVQLQTKWGQRGVYGQYCPNGISGCVATAIGQIMAYKAHPANFVTTVSMGNDYAVGDTVQMNWTLVNQHVVNHSGIVQQCDSVHNQIGALLREIGDNVDMTYGPNSSSAYMTNVPDALDYFGYGYLPYTTVNISNMELSIKINCPVLVAGVTNNYEGHAWVADGFKDFEYWRQEYYASPLVPGVYVPRDPVLYAYTKLIHFNWGWNGVCNGYFAFNCYDTSQGTIYDDNLNYATYDFGNNVHMYANIDDLLPE